MGNNFVFPAPKCSYTNTSLAPFYILIPSDDQNSNVNGKAKKDKYSIPALHIKTNVRSKYLIVYSHGNSEDLGRLYYSLLDYHERFQIDILAPEYPGYGLHKGKTSAANLVRATEQAILYATKPEGLGYELKNTILIGRSIGTGVAIEIAAKYSELRGIVLISAFCSIREVAQNIAGSVTKLLIPDILKNISIIDQVKCPTLFIHGKKDELIPYSHSVELFYKAKCVKKLSLSDDMDHNRSKSEKDIYKPIENFLLEDLQIKDIKNLVLEELNVLTITSEIPDFSKSLGPKKPKNKNRKTPLKIDNLSKETRPIAKEERKVAENDFNSTEFHKPKVSVGLQYIDIDPPTPKKKETEMPNGSQTTLPADAEK